LLREWMANGVTPTYRPIDISANALRMIRTLMAEKLPGLTVQGIQGDNLEVLTHLSKAEVPRTFLFLGSNIGNMGYDSAVELMRSIRQKMNASDRLMIGFDLKKDPRRILKAYDDDAGITREFNLNLLRRINRELGADFKVECFEHAPSYDPKTGKAESHLVSTVEQEVRIPGSPDRIHFHTWEAIHTETSQKYDTAMIKA
ncbi:MAG: L-histidine N(alpha)-methyltransferase, partial [Bacteroidota bacterium]|nr:L-histidine N(alpha)-methyltransferase [Bacteroidota bacterium]